MKFAKSNGEIIEVDSKSVLKGCFHHYATMAIFTKSDTWGNDTELIFKIEYVESLGYAKPSKYKVSIPGERTRCFSTNKYSSAFDLFADKVCEFVGTTNTVIFHDNKYLLLPDGCLVTPCADTNK